MYFMNCLLLIFMTIINKSQIRRGNKKVKCGSEPKNSWFIQWNFYYTWDINNTKHRNCAWAMPIFGEYAFSIKDGDLSEAWYYFDTAFLLFTWVKHQIILEYPYNIFAGFSSSIFTLNIQKEVRVEMTGGNIVFR